MTRDQILAKADQCVKCGLCLPHCPTYRLTRDEGDSPRGRISLMQAFAASQIESDRLHRHLDRCLGCRQCEAACPSGVQYGSLLDATRALHPPRPLPQWKKLLGLIATLPYQRAASSLTSLYANTGLRWLTDRSGSQTLQQLNRLMPGQVDSSPLRKRYPAQGEHRGTIGLFTGCVGRLVDRRAIDAALKLLPHLGIEVHVPANQGCCGALHQHNGHPDDAIRMGEHNATAFGGLRLDAVLTLASGCGAQLLDYPAMGVELDAPVMDISEYILRLDLLKNKDIRPLDSRIAVHIPCSMPTTGAQSPAAVLLSAIPEARVSTLSNTGCCGAAGSYLITQPEMADVLREATLAQTREAAPHYLATSNTGCAMHLAGGLKQDKAAPEVVHPVELITRQLLPTTA